MPNTRAKIQSLATNKITFHTLEILNMKFEDSTERSIRHKNGFYPLDATTAWFDDFCYGVFWVRGQTAFYGGFVPKFVYQVNHKCKPFTRDGFTANVGISPIDNISNASTRFLVMVDEYKKKYGYTVLQPFTW